MSKVFTQNGILRNVGDWRYQYFQQEVINRPFPGPMEAPDDWDYQITYIEVASNPLPDDHIEEDLEWYFDANGCAQLERNRQSLADSDAVARNLAGIKAEFDSIWPDIVLGTADEATIERAKVLRAEIKAA